MDASGVHPLLLAIGSERYVSLSPDGPTSGVINLRRMPFSDKARCHWQNNLWIIDEACAPELNIDEIGSFFLRMLERVDWERDLHFQTKTTMDTLDYSGLRFESRIQVVIAAVGPPIRELPTEIPADLNLPDGFRNPQFVSLVCSRSRLRRVRVGFGIMRFFVHFARLSQPILRSADSHWSSWVDDSEFTANSLNNFLWTVFTRSNPAADIDGVDASVVDKHWGCRGDL